MNKKTSIILVVLTLITVPLLKLQAAPATLADIGFTPNSAAEFLDDTQKVVDAMRFLNAYREYGTYSELGFSYDATRNAQVTAERALGFDRVCAVMRYTNKFNSLRGGFSDDLKSFVEKYDSMVSKIELNLQPFVEKAKAILVNQPYELAIEDQKKIIDNYFSKYPRVGGLKKEL